MQMYSQGDTGAKNIFLNLEGCAI